MVGGGSASGSASGFYIAAPNSETDGETLDGETDFDEFEEWDYSEIIANMYV